MRKYRHQAQFSIEKKVELNKPLIAIVVVVFLLMGFFVYKAFDFYSAIKKPSTNNRPTKKPEEKNTYNVLLLGYGGGKHEGTYLTDTIMVLHTDLKTKKAVLISIPRDLWVKVPTKTGEDFHYKINAVYQMGLFPKEFPAVDQKYTAGGDDAGLIKKVVTDITGLQIDAYAAIDFQGFVEAVDILGGIDVVVDKTFDDYEYPVEGKEEDPCDKKDQELEEALKIATEDARLAFPCRYEHLHFDAGKMHMDGETALKYARSRHALQDGGDFNRAKRQQKVLEASRDKVLSIGFIPKIIPLLDEMKEHISTDMPLDELQKLLGEAGKRDEYKVVNFVISQENFLKDDFTDFGQYIIIPNVGIDNWSEIQKEIKNTRLGITPSPTPTEKVTPSVTPRVKKVSATTTP